MQRRHFLLTAILATPAVTIANLPRDRNPKGFVIRNGESRFGEKTSVGPSPNNIKVAGKDTDGQLTVFDYTGKEKGGPPLHLHPHQDEIFFIVDGQYRFQVGDEQFTLQAGDTIFLPRNVPHTFAQLTDEGKMFFFFQPAGKMEDFFRAVSALTGPPSPEQAAKIFEAHDMKVVGAPLKF